MSPALSVQLYTVSAELTADPEGTLARLAQMGLRDVEVFDFVRRAPELAASLERHGLRARTGHAPLVSDELPTPEGMVAVPPVDDVFAAARTLGLEIVFDPFVVPERWLAEDDVTATARRLNEAAARAGDFGLQVGYHNHAQEFIADFGGRSAYEVFVDALDEDVVLEVDLYWAATGKQDVPALLGRLGERVRALHLKDGSVLDHNPCAAGLPEVEPHALRQRPAGQGDLPLLDYLAAAPSTEFGIIEFDFYDGDIFEGIQASVTYLNEHGIR